MDEILSEGGCVISVNDLLKLAIQGCSSERNVAETTTCNWSRVKNGSGCTLKDFVDMGLPSSLSRWDYSARVIEIGNGHVTRHRGRLVFRLRAPVGVGRDQMMIER
jgi:hypothetical protein